MSFLLYGHLIALHVSLANDYGFLSVLQVGLAKEQGSFLDFHGNMLIALL
jgi:hypothetical protein